MPRTRGASDIQISARTHVGQHEDGLSQRKITEKLSMSLSTVNRVIV